MTPEEAPASLHSQPQPPGPLVLPGVQLGADCEVDPMVFLGRPPRGRRPGELPLVIGPGAVIRAFTTIYGGTTIGARFQTGHGASIRDANGAERPKAFALNATNFSSKSISSLNSQIRRSSA